MLDVKSLSNLIDVARRKKPADIIIKNAKIINVFTESIEEGNIAISEGFIAGVGTTGKRYKYMMLIEVTLLLVLLILICTLKVQCLSQLSLPKQLSL